MSENYFNGRAWRSLGLGEQEVKFLEALWSRSGGAQEPAQDLGEVVTTVTSIEQSTNQISAEVHRLKRVISDQVNNESHLISIINKLAHRVSQLEDAQ